MKRPLTSAKITALGLAALLVFPAAARAEEQATQLLRDAAGIQQVKKIAIMPVVTQLRFDRDSRIPDPARAASRMVVAGRAAAMLETRLQQRKAAALPPEAVLLVMKENGWDPTDFYAAVRRGSFDAPAETITNKKKDEARLLATRAEMKQTPDSLSVYRYHWHDLPDEHVGLAAFKLDASAQIDPAKAKLVAEKTGADALLYCQVGDIETHEAATGLGVLTGEKFKSTRTHLYMTLYRPSDGAILWQARARGVKSQKSGVFTGERAFNAEDRKAIEGAAQAADLLMADLFEGTGKPPKERG